MIRSYALQDDLQQWKERLTAAEFAEYRKLFECVKDKRVGPSFDQATATAVAGISSILTSIGSIREERLQEIPIDPSRLLEVGKWASASGFSGATGAFPLPMFRTVEFSSDELEIRRSLLLQGISKGEFTQPEMAQRAVNENELYQDLLRNHVAASVLYEVIRRLAPQDQDGSDPETYWEHVERYAKNAKNYGGHPILLIENRTVPEWVYNWTNRYREREAQLPAGITAWHDPENQEEAYIGNLNDIAIYVAPLAPGGSILMTVESFDSVSFTKLADDRFVEVEAVPVATGLSVIDLRLTWRFDVRVDQYPTIKLSYAGRRRHARRS